MAQKNEKTIQDVILDSISEGVFTVDLDFKITSFNRAAQQITGIPADMAVGQQCKDILRADICERDCALRKTIQTERPIISRPVQIIDAEGNRKAISINTALLKDHAAKVIGGVETFLDMTALENLRKQIEQKYSFEDIISRNHRMLELFKICPAVAHSQSTVLIEGESGTGKELFARAVHSLSPRNANPFVAVNCGALPETLLESELFGYKAGAFTDAKTDKPGRFAVAEKGTLFLDEIADIPPAVQVKLLRVLQERIYEPLGSVEPVKADVRIVAATNSNLEKLMQKNKFRQDLYYRINVVKLNLPPLHDRKEDIPLLVRHFIDRFNRVKNKHIHGITDEALAALLSHNYPGNVRELENVIEHCFVLCPAGLIGKRHLPPAFQNRDSGDFASMAGPTTMNRMEKILISEALRRNKGNKNAAARELGIHKSTLFRKIKALGIQP